MIFEKSNTTYLAEKLCINVGQFEADLIKRFGSNAKCFDLLISLLLQDEAKISYLNLIK